MRPIQDKHGIFSFFPERVGGNPVFVEVGAGHGSTSRWIIDNSPRGSNIVLYEVDETNYKILKKNIQGFLALLEESERPRQVVCHNEAIVGNRTGHTTLYVGGTWAGCSVTHDHHQHEITVPCASLEKVFEENSIDHIDVLFLNCEGAEFGILKELGEKPHLGIDQISIAVHFHMNEEVSEMGDGELIEWAGLANRYRAVVMPDRHECSRLMVRK